MQTSQLVRAGTEIVSGLKGSCSPPASHVLKVQDNQNLITHKSLITPLSSHLLISPQLPLVRQLSHALGRSHTHSLVQQQRVIAGTPECWALPDQAWKAPSSGNPYRGFHCAVWRQLGGLTGLRWSTTAL